MLWLFIAIFVCVPLEIIAEGSAETASLVENEEIYAPTDSSAADKNIELIIQDIAAIAKKAEKARKDGILPIEEIEEEYDKMIEVLDELIEMFTNKNNVHKFIKAKGIVRVIGPNLGIAYTELRRQLLILLKIFFDVAPKATKALTPLNVVDKLLDILDYDNNLALKAHALDILYLWLPNNPKHQARVMKLKGLDPFYKHITKLDTSVIHTLLDLFNTILNEHLKVRNGTIKLDHDKAKIYQRIGLIERMSTTTVCNGLLNIFEATWSYKTKDNTLIVPVFELIKNVQPFCINNFKGKPKAEVLFDALLKYVKDEQRKEEFINYGINVTEITEVLEDYFDNLKPVKEEL